MNESTRETPSDNVFSRLGQTIKERLGEEEGQRERGRKDKEEDGETIVVAQTRSGYYGAEYQQKQSEKLYGVCSST